MTEKCASKSGVARQETGAERDGSCRCKAATGHRGNTFAPTADLSLCPTGGGGKGCVIPFTIFLLSRTTLDDNSFIDMPLGDGKPLGKTVAYTLSRTLNCGCLATHVPQLRWARQRKGQSLVQNRLFPGNMLLGAISLAAL